MRILITTLLLLNLILIEKTFAEETPESSDLIGPVPQKVERSSNYIKDFFNGAGNLKISGTIVNKDLIKNLYKKSDYNTIWFTDNALNVQSKKALKFLSQAEYNGLDPKEFDTGVIHRRFRFEDPQKISYTDILITDMVSRMISQISYGRITPQESGIDSYNMGPQKAPKLSKLFQEFLEAEDIEKFIDKYSPQLEAYKDLKVALAKIIEERNTKTQEFPKIKEGPDILPGARDYRISDIKKRFGSPSTINTRAREDYFIYYKELQREVMAFQKKFGIKPNGVINNKTVAALNVDETDLIKKISVNMDRLRWIPRDLEDKRVMINIASQKLMAYENGKEAFRQELIIGRSEKKTALMNTVFTNIVFNPYWHAPRGYTLKNLLPILKENPKYLEQEEFDAIRFAPDGRWIVVDPKTIDWNNVTDKNLDFVLRQKPGKKNALGPTKFSLVNNFDIYMHGTSEPWLFSSDYRAQSSGCIRVEDPLKLALYSLKDNTDVPEEKYMSYYEAFNDPKITQETLPKHVTVAFKNPIHIYINYQTVVSDEKGNLTFSDDIYGWDSKMQESLKNLAKNQAISN